MMNSHEEKPLDKNQANKPEIAIDVFNQIEIKVGLVKAASPHKNAKKLLVLQVEIDEGVKQIVSGIAEYYEPQDLVSKKLLVITNLEPIKLRGETSEGMILCGENKDKQLFVIEANSALDPGDLVR
jgi:methionyl-tRNA synthetase